MSENEIDENHLSQYNKYVQPFKYAIGEKSWNSSNEINPDAFVIYYFYLNLTNEIKISPDYPLDSNFGNPMIPAEELEYQVKRHFDVSSEYIRTSTYFDSSTQSYWTGGIGTTIDIQAIGTNNADGILTIFYNASIVSDEGTESWDGNIIVDVTSSENYRYVSYYKNKN